MATVKQQFVEVKSLLDQVHNLVEGGTPSDISKAASILKSILPVYKDLSSNEESKRPENLEILKEIKIRLAEETSRVMSKKEEARKYQNENTGGMMSQSLSTSQMNKMKIPTEIPKPPLLQGYLKKQGEKGLVKGFKKRWFQQKDTKLYYYEKEGDTNSYGFINLPDMMGVKNADQGFELATPTRVYVLQVLKPSDLNYWTEGLKEYKKYYSSLTNNQKFAQSSGSNEIPIISSGENTKVSSRPLANTMGVEYLQSAYLKQQQQEQNLNSNSNFNNSNVITSNSSTTRDLRRGTVSVVESQFNNKLTNRDDLDELDDDDDVRPNGRPILNSNSNTNNNTSLSSSYNPSSSIDEGLKKREEELRKRFLEQKQQEEQAERIRQHEDEKKKQENEQARLQKEQKDREQEDLKKQEQERERQRSILFQQQEDEIKKRLSMQIESSSISNLHSNSNGNTPQTSTNNNITTINSTDNSNNTSTTQSPILASTNNTSNTSSSNNNTNNSNNNNISSMIDLDLIKRNIEDELKKKFLQQQDEILEIERQRRNDLEREIKRVKEMLLATQNDSNSSDSLQMDLQMNVDEIDRLKRELKESKEQVARLDKLNKDLSIKPQEKFNGEYKWTEEITSRDKTIIQLQAKIRELDETVKLNENAVSSIQRENEMLREETEKKDRYITELMEKSKDSSNGGGSGKNSQQTRRGSMDVTKLKEALSAHQSQNSFLMAEIQRLENDSALKLEIKAQHLDEVQKQLDENINQFHTFRSFLLGNSSSKDYYDKVEKENLDVKKEYFHTLGVSIKLHRAREGQNSNIDIHSLYEEAVKSNVFYKNWPEWLSTHTLDKK